MAAQNKRKLGIPIYDARVVPEGTVLDDEGVLEAEVIGDGPTLGERVRSRVSAGAEAAAETARNIRANGARDALFTERFDEARTAAGDADPRIQERQQGRARRRDQERVRREQTADVKRDRAERSKLAQDAKTDPLAKLKLDTIRAGESYMDSLRRSQILAAGQTKATQRKQLSDMHQVYASMMVLQCVEPLRQGLRGHNIVNALGMGASMWLLSPNFRVQVQNFVGQVGDAIREKIDGRGDKKDAKAQSRFEKLASRGKGDQLAARWRKRLDRIENAERGHRLPFTAQSAAMTEVALAEAAYADMRRPGADRRAVQDRYESALSALYEYVDDDGLDRDEVSRSMRVIVGQRLEADPSIANVFSELGHGRFTKSEPREVYINGTTDTATVWTGDFVDSYEGRTISAGSFSLRPPMGVNEHRVLSAETLAAELTSARTVAEMNDALSQYVVAASVGQYPAVVDELEDRAAQRRFGKVHTMFASMQADGLSAEEQHFAYSAAYVDAVEVAQRLKPELSAAWVAQYGENWREKVAEDIARYNAMGAAAERERRGPTDGGHFPSSGTHPHGQARDEEAYSTEDIVDAEVVDDLDAHQMPSRGDRSRPTPPRPGTARRSRALEDLVYEGDVLPDTTRGADAEIINGELVETAELGAAPNRAAILAGAASTVEGLDEDEHADRSTAAGRIRRARVNQHYNEVDTGGITGIGRDDAEPLQDVDFQLG
jgi:hypothetical protein